MGRSVACIGLRCRPNGSRDGLAQNSEEHRVDRLFRRRCEGLAQSFAIVSALLGLSLLGVSLVKLFFGATSSVGQFSSAQAVQGILGAVLVWLGFSGAAKRFFLNAFAQPSNQVRVFLFPLLVWPFFLFYRFAVEQHGELKVYLRRITEGSIVEWLSFIFLLFSAWLLWQAVSEWGAWKAKLTGRSFAVLLFVAAMEEMSWGQMIFNWGTPELLDSLNRQQETNMHNLTVFHDYTWTAFAVVFTLLGVLCAMRFLLPSSLPFRRHQLATLVLPVSCAFSYFVIAAIIYWGVVLEKSGIDLAYLHTREQEIAECLAAIGIFIHCVYLYLQPSQQRSSAQFE